ncbi:MAG TPA: FAD-dependent oxidoreductase [Solirubrobacteraceae bacterium]|nr:FAD-dependent oxidoreductase [Solirubrobacteraceae bacterium]
MGHSAGDISHWFAQLYPDGLPPARPSLSGAVEADVCIVGAGYSGLWTAYELRRADPGLKVVVVEAEIAGFGASGRNGGAVIALLQGTREQWARRGDRAGAIALEREIIHTVDEVGNVIRREGIDCGFSKNGVLEVARSAGELEHFQRMVERDREWGFGPEDYAMLDAAQTRDRIAVAGVVGARFSPHCASIHPGALVRGLADAVERAGATIYEGSPVIRIDPGRAVTASGEARARFVIRATEAYTDSLESHRRRIVPVHTSMLVTAPIPDELWAPIGWSGREALLAEHPFLHLQHTADRRITIGGDDNRVPYRYGSRPSPLGRAPSRVAEMYRAELIRLFPSLREIGIERSWQGVFGAPRSWMPGVHLDRSSGLGWLGGYVGEGVAPSNLAGRTMRDLILGRDSELTHLPLVGAPPRRWEPEPLRYTGAAVIGALRSVGTRRELRTDRPSRLIELGNRLAGYKGHG